MSLLDQKKRIEAYMTPPDPIETPQNLLEFDGMPGYNRAQGSPDLDARGKASGSYFSSSGMSEEDKRKLARDLADPYRVGLTDDDRPNPWKVRIQTDLFYFDTLSYILPHPILSYPVNIALCYALYWCIDSVERFILERPLDAIRLQHRRQARTLTHVAEDLHYEQQLMLQYFPDFDFSSITPHPNDTTEQRMTKHTLFAKKRNEMWDRAHQDNIEHAAELRTRQKRIIRITHPPQERKGLMSRLLGRRRRRLPRGARRLDSDDDDDYSNEEDDDEELRNYKIVLHQFTQERQEQQKQLMTLRTLQQAGAGVGASSENIEPDPLLEELDPHSEEYKLAVRRQKRREKRLRRKRRQLEQKYQEQAEDFGDLYADMPALLDHEPFEVRLRRFNDARYREQQIYIILRNKRRELKQNHPYLFDKTAVVIPDVHFIDDENNPHVSPPDLVDIPVDESAAGGSNGEGTSNNNSNTSHHDQNTRPLPALSSHATPPAVGFRTQYSESQARAIFQMYHRPTLTDEEIASLDPHFDGYRYEFIEYFHRNQHEKHDMYHGFSFTLYNDVGGHTSRVDAIQQVPTPSESWWSYIGKTWEPVSRTFRVGYTLLRSSLPMMCVIAGLTRAQSHPLIMMSMVPVAFLHHIHSIARKYANPTYDFSSLDDELDRLIAEEFGPDYMQEKDPQERSPEFIQQHAEFMEQSEHGGAGQTQEILADE